MKAYTYQIGKGSDDEMENVVFAKEMFADSLGEAVDKAKATTRTRPKHANEDMVHVRDEAQPDNQVVWARSAEDIRNA